MIIKVYSQMSPSATLLLTDPQGISQQLCALASQLASDAIVSITAKTRGIADPQGLDGQRIQREAAKQFDSIPVEVNSAAVDFLRPLSSQLQVSTSFLTPNELVVTVDTLPSAGVYSLAVH